MTVLRAVSLVLALLVLPEGAPAQAPTPAQMRFDPAQATRAYLATVPPEKRARSDAYSEGGYWLLVWEFVNVVAAAWVLLATKWSAKFRDLAERLTRVRALRSYLCWVQYSVVTAALLFPLTVYAGYVREHEYGLANQTFGPWLADRAKELAVVLVLDGIGVVLLYEILARSPKRWWVWGSLAATVMVAFSVMIAPVFIFPLFNRYTPLSDESIRGPILSLARANGIPATDVYVSDASRQTTRISANVSGLLGTTRITLNDNLLKRCSLPEIESVMGHEMGHYVLHHLFKGVVFIGILIVAGFAFFRAAFEAISRRYGARWGIRGAADPAGIPLFAALIAVTIFVLTPLTNTITRVQEAEADIFGLNAAHQPDGFAEVSLKLGEYRKLDPSPLEEVLFYDHPGGRARIFTAMRWKAEHGP